MILDNNKNISAIQYNYLNLPSMITVTGKGTISYVFDAAGARSYPYGELHLCSFKNSLYQAEASF